MTFNEAVEELKVLAGKDVWAFQYEVASYLPNVQIHAYIDRPFVGHAAPHNTYAGAIANIKVKINTAAEISDPAPEDRTFEAAVETERVEMAEGGK